MESYILNHDPYFRIYLINQDCNIFFPELLEQVFPAVVRIPNSIPWSVCGHSRVYSSDILSLDYPSSSFGRSTLSNCFLFFLRRHIGLESNKYSTPTELRSFSRTITHHSLLVRFRTGRNIIGCFRWGLSGRIKANDWSWMWVMNSKVG